MKKLHMNGSALDTFGIKVDFSILGILSTAIFVFFILPWRIFKTMVQFSFNPKWEHIRSIERVVIIPVTNIFLGERSASMAIHKLIDIYFQAYSDSVKHAVQVSIRPIYQDIDRVVDGYKFTKIITALMMSLFYMLLFSMVLELGFNVSAFTVLIVGMIGGANVGTAVIGFVIAFMLYVAIFLLGSWLILVAYHFLAHMIKESTIISSDELEDFVDNLTDYTFTKMAETNGVEAMEFVERALKESLILKNNHSLVETANLSEATKQIMER